MDSPKTQAHTERLRYLPISFFASVMGLAGLTLAWSKAQHVWGVDWRVTPVLTVLTSVIFLLLGSLYFRKWARYPESVQQELKHPVKLSFFPAISISLLLLSILYLDGMPAISRSVWILGAALHLSLTLYVINAWMHQGHFKIQHMTPAWFIPAVGNVLVPVAGVPLGFTEVSWFFFSVGMLFWVILLTIVFYRVLFHDPIDARLLPTLFILIAPPAVGFIAYMKLQSGALDGVGRVLYYIGLFLTMMLLSQAGRFARLPFALSWWAYSFPTAAISIASFVMFQATGKSAYLWTGTALLLALTALVGLLISKTLEAIRMGKICTSEH